MKTEFGPLRDLEKPIKILQNLENMLKTISTKFQVNRGSIEEIINKRMLQLLIAANSQRSLAELASGKVPLAVGFYSPFWTDIKSQIRVKLILHVFHYGLLHCIQIGSHLSNENPSNQVLSPIISPLASNNRSTVEKGL